MTTPPDDLSEIEALARAAEDARVAEAHHFEVRYRRELLHQYLDPARTLRLIERLREAEREASNLCEHLTAAHEVAVAAEARAEALEVERDEARTGERNMSDHARLVAAEASDAFASMEDIAEFRDACGYPGNRATLTPAEQVSSIIRERDAAEARATALEAALGAAIASLEDVHNIAKARHGTEIEDAMQSIWRIAGSAANKARALTKETGHG